MNGDATRPLHVLLVEDDPDHAELTLLALEEHDPRHRVDHVADGAAAADYLFQRGDYAGADRPDSSSSTSTSPAGAASTCSRS